MKAMNDEQFNEFCNDLLTACFEDPENSKFSLVCNKYSVDLGDARGKEIFQEAASRIDDWMNGKYSFDQLTKANQDRIISIEIAGIVEKYRAIRGEDITQIKDGLLVSPKLLKEIASNLPPEIVEEMKSRGVIQTRPPNFYDSLEEDLGIPFFDSIQAIAKLRILTLTDTQMTIYSSSLLGGIEKRHPWLESNNFAPRFIAVICGERLYKKLSITKTIIYESMETVSTMVADDLLTALGRFERTLHPLTGAMILSKDDVLALDKVHSLQTTRWIKIAEMLADF
jgi:hypothetical protein